MGLPYYIKKEVKKLIKCCIKTLEDNVALLQNNSFTASDVDTGAFQTLSNTPELKQTADFTNLTVGDSFKMEWEINAQAAGATFINIEVTVDYNDGGGEIVVANKSMDFTNVPAIDGRTGFEILTIPSGSNGTITVKTYLSNNDGTTQIASNDSKVFIRKI